MTILPSFILLMLTILASSASENMAMYEQLLKPGTILKHYKGKYYEVIGLGYFASHAEPLKHPLLFYKALYDDPAYGNNALWSRSLGEFFQKINYEDQEMVRFEIQTEK